MWAARADEAWRPLARDGLRRERRGLVVLDGPGGRLAPLWPLSQVIWAAAELAPHDVETPNDQLLVTLERYRRRDAFAALPRSRERYFDDNAWLGLAAARMHEIAPAAGWSDVGGACARWVPTGEHPDGGVRWVEGGETRNTCSTASAAWLVQAASTPDARRHAARWLTWLDTTLRREDGLYGDHVDGRRIAARAWSYNQGSVLAARAMLGWDVAELAGAAMNHWTRERLWREPPAFLAILLRALLTHTRLVARTTDWIDPYLDRAWNGARDADGWLTGGGIGSYDGKPTIDQAAFVQMFALRAAST